MRRVDFGVCSFRNPERLRATLASIEATAQTDWRCYIIHNPSEGESDEQAKEVIARATARNRRFIFIELPTNGGYARSINFLYWKVQTKYFVYLDNDVELLTPGWDERFCDLMDRDTRIGQVFPGGGHFGFFNGDYHECLWNAGYCWAARKSALPLFSALGPMDTTLGHHEEVDLMIRLRLAGYRIACMPYVQVLHHETATNANEADHKPGGRIHDGVVRWMNKWNRYFCGEDLKYSMTEYDDRALRYTDWPPCALYLERMVLSMFPNWNYNPRKVDVPGVGIMDAVEVLKPAGPYKGRAI